MYKQNSPFKKVRKTKEGLALKRWFKEDWRTPSGVKTTATVMLCLDLQRKLAKILLKHIAS